jgi:DNA-binding response OmpR family regulator
LSLLLQLPGNNVSSAYDGEQALEPWGHTAILIAITGWGQAEDNALSRDAGFDHQVVKPVDPDALLKLIQQRNP